MSYCRIVRAIRRFCLDCQGGGRRAKCGYAPTLTAPCGSGAWPAPVSESWPWTPVTPVLRGMMPCPLPVGSLPFPPPAIPCRRPCRRLSRRLPARRLAPCKQGGPRTWRPGRRHSGARRLLTARRRPLWTGTATGQAFPPSAYPPETKARRSLPCGPSVASASIAAAFATPCAGATPARRARCGHTVSVYSPKPTAGCVAASAARVPLSCRDFP